MSATLGQYDYLLQWVPVLVFVAAGAAFVVAARRFRSSGAELRPRPPTDAVFFAKNIRAAISGNWHNTVNATGAMAWVTPGELFVALPFPLNVMAYSFGAPHKWVAPLSSVRVASSEDAKVVDLQMELGPGKTSRIRLFPHAPRELRAALKL